MHVYTFTCHVVTYNILHTASCHCKHQYYPSLLFLLFLLPFLISPSLPLSSHAQEEQDSHIIHANPMPQFDSVFKPQLPHKTTEIQPFTFEERYQGKPTRETLVQQILQKEKVQCMDPDNFPKISVTLAAEYLQFVYWKLIWGDHVPSLSS